jgi:hypothetical protein
MGCAPAGAAGPAAQGGNGTADALAALGALAEGDGPTPADD